MAAEDLETEDLEVAWVIVRSIFVAKARNPVSLVANLLVNSLDVVVPVLGTAMLLHAFGSLGGWDFSQVALLLGSANFAVAVSLIVVGAFDSFLFASIYRSGQFESALMRPLNPIVFLAAVSLRPYRFGRLIASIVLTCFALVWIGDMRWHVLAVLPVVFMVAPVIISALWFIDAAAVLRFGQSNDLTRNIPFIATDLAFYPQGLYPLSLRLVSQFVFGTGAAIYLPLAYALGKSPNFGFWSVLAGPLTALMMIVVIRDIWKRAVGEFEIKGGM